MSKLTTTGSREAVVVVVAVAVVADGWQVRLATSPLTIVLTRSFGESPDAISAADGGRRIGEESDNKKNNALPPNSLFQNSLGDQNFLLKSDFIEYRHHLKHLSILKPEQTSFVLKNLLLSVIY